MSTYFYGLGSRAGMPGKKAIIGRFAQRSRGRRRCARLWGAMWRSPRSAATSACPVLYEAACPTSNQAGEYRTYEPDCQKSLFFNLEIFSIVESVILVPSKVVISLLG